MNHNKVEIVCMQQFEYLVGFFIGEAWDVKGQFCELFISESKDRSLDVELLSMV